MNVDTHLRHARRIARPLHDERLVDDAIEATFPASDPVSPAQPGSIVNLRYAAAEVRELPVPARGMRTLAWLAAGCATALVLVVIALHGTHRNTLRK